MQDHTTDDEDGIPQSDTIAASTIYYGGFKSDHWPNAESFTANLKHFQLFVTANGIEDAFSLSKVKSFGIFGAASPQRRV